jgi:hypothetical protein
LAVVASFILYLWCCHLFGIVYSTTSSIHFDGVMWASASGPYSGVFTYDELASEVLSNPSRRGPFVVLSVLDGPCRVSGGGRCVGRLNRYGECSRDFSEMVWDDLTLVFCSQPHVKVVSFCYTFPLGLEVHSGYVLCLIWQISCLDEIHIMIIFPSVPFPRIQMLGTRTLGAVLPLEVCWQKFTWRKIRRSKNSTVIDRESIFLSIPVEFFSIAVFFRGEQFKILTFLGLAGVRFLFLSRFYIGILKCLPSKKKHFRTPRARSETGFGILSEFRSRTDL